MLHRAHNPKIVTTLGKMIYLEKTGGDLSCRRCVTFSMDADPLETVVKIVPNPTEKVLGFRLYGYWPCAYVFSSRIV